MSASVTRKAKEVLGALQERILAKAKELQTIEDAITLKKSKTEELDREMQSMRSEIFALDKKRDVLRKENSGLEHRITENRNVASHSEFVIARANDVIKAQDIVIADNQKKIELLEKAEKDARETYKSGVEEVKKLNIHIDTLKNEGVIMDQKVVSAQKTVLELDEERKKILNSIEQAVGQFRLFERRIHQFAKDTGYIVGYDRPDLSKINT